MRNSEPYEFATTLESLVVVAVATVTSKYHCDGIPPLNDCP
jgi:hypothetical protein